MRHGGMDPFQRISRESINIWGKKCMYIKRLGPWAPSRLYVNVLILLEWYIHEYSTNITVYMYLGAKNTHNTNNLTKNGNTTSQTNITMTTCILPRLAVNIKCWVTPQKIKTSREPIQSFQKVIYTNIPIWDTWTGKYPTFKVAKTGW